MLKTIKTFLLGVFLISPIVLLILYTFNTIHSEKSKDNVNLSNLKLVTPVAIIDEITNKIEEEDIEDALVKIKEDLPDVNIPSSKGTPLLVLVAEKDYSDIVGTLIQMGANPDKADLNTSETALIKAIRNKNFDTISILLNAGANPNLGTNRGLTPLNLAIDLRDETLATLLLSSGATNGVSEDNLLLYAYQKNPIGVSLMLSGGVKPNVIDKDDNTPLIISSSNGDFESVKQLISYRANVNAKNKHRMTPLLYAVKGKYWEVAEYLLNNGAKINSSNIYGQNALFWAVYHGNAKIVKDLLARGANYTKKTRKGQTALQMARALGHKEVAKILEDFIAYKNLPRDSKGNIILPKVNQQQNVSVTNNATAQGVSTSDSVKNDVLSEIKNQTIPNQQIDQQAQQVIKDTESQQAVVETKDQTQQLRNSSQRKTTTVSSNSQTVTQPAKTQINTLQTNSNDGAMQLPEGMDMSTVMSMMNTAQSKAGSGAQNTDINAMMKQMQSAGSQSGSKTQIPNMPSNMEMPAGMNMNDISKMIPAGALPAGVDLNSLSSMSPEQLKKMGVPEDQISNITKAQQGGQVQDSNASSSSFQPKDLSKNTNSTYANGMVKTQINKLKTSGN